jgi:hypothetical protein
VTAASALRSTLRAAWRFPLYLALAAVLGVLCWAALQWHREMAGVADAAGVVGRLARPHPAGVNAPAVDVPQSDLVTGRKGGFLRRSRPAVARAPLSQARPAQPAPAGTVRVEPQVEQPTAAQEVAIGKETGLPPPAPGELRVWGPGHVPCVFDASDRATYDCPRKGARFRGYADVRLGADGSFRLVAKQETPGFFETPGLRDGWEAGGGPSYGLGGVGLVLELRKNLLRTGRVTWVIEARGEATAAKADGRAALLGVWRAGVP